jgi:hypothetical protein
VEAAQLAGVTSLSHYVRDAVSGRVGLERALREEDERLKENLRLRRIAADRLADSGLGRPLDW